MISCCSSSSAIPAWLPKGVRKNLASHSDGIVVVDQWGNMAVVGHPINTSLWGNTGIFVDGISIPDAASFQPRDIARAGPGKHLSNGMNPTLFLRDGKAVLGCSAVGGGLHYKTLQALAWCSISEWTRRPQWTHRRFCQTELKTARSILKSWKA